MPPTKSHQNPFIKVLTQQVNLAKAMLKSIKSDTEYYSRVSKEAYPGTLEVSAGIQTMCYAYQDTHNKACKQLEKAKATLSALRDYPNVKKADLTKGGKLVRELSTLINSANRRIERVVEDLKEREANPSSTELRPKAPRIKKKHTPFDGYHTGVGGGSFGLVTPPLSPQSTVPPPPGNRNSSWWSNPFGIY